MLDKKLLRDNCYAIADNVTFKKDGSVVFKRGYFYRNGMSAEKFGEIIEARLKKLGLEPKSIETLDRWAPWPRDSYFSATVKF